MCDRSTNTSIIEKKKQTKVIVSAMYYTNPHGGGIGLTAKKRKIEKESPASVLISEDLLIINDLSSENTKIKIARVTSEIAHRQRPKI